MFLRRLKDVTKKTSLLRCLWDLWDIPANICWSWRRLRQVFSITILYLPRRLQDVLEDGLEDVLEDEKCYAEDVLKTCLEDVLKTCLEDVLKPCLQDLLKTLWRQTKDLLGISVYLSQDNKSKCVSNKSVFHKSISDNSKANPKCINYWFGVMKLA